MQGKTYLNIPRCLAGAGEGGGVRDKTSVADRDPIRIILSDPYRNYVMRIRIILVL
jgi:hypothetical protein